MLNTNNTVNYEINVKRKEKKYSWSTVFAWLYLKTIGRILPKKWNKWAENILYYDKATGSNEIHTDGLKTTDESAQIDLKPGITEKESQSEVISKDGGVQTTFQDITMQTECVETTDRNIGADLKPEVAEKGSQSEIISKDGEVQTNKVTFHDIAMQTECVETTDKNSDQAQQIADLQSENGLLEVKIEELRSIIIRLKADLQSKNSSLKKENRELRSIIERLKKDYRELVEVTDKQEKEFLVKLKAKSEMIECQGRELTELRAEFTDKIDELLERVGEVRKKNSLMSLNERSGEDQKAMVENLKRQLQSIQESKQQLGKEKIDLEGKLKDLSNQLSTAEVEKKSSENEVARLQEQVRILEGNKEWELAGIDDSLKKVFLDVIGMLEKELLINNQEQQLQGKKVDLIERLKAELKKESDEALQETREKLAEQEKLIEQLKKEQKQVEDQLKADIKKLQGEKENMEEQLKIMQQQLLNNQEQQKLEEKLKDVDKRLEDIDGETKKSQGQTKTKTPDAVSLVSTVSTVKSTTGSSKSTLSKLRNLPNKLFGDKNLNNFLSKKNEELKKGFPEFKEKHFCHNVLNETIKSLSNQDDGKFESSKLLELLKNNLKKSAREIIEAKVKEVVNEHCNIGKNVDKELRDGTLKAKLLTSIKQCMKKLNFNEKDAVATKDSILQSFHRKNNNNNESGALLKEIVTGKLTEAKMKSFSSEVQKLQLVSSIRDKFLSPDQKMCSHVLGEGNTYQLSTNKVSGPNSSMSSPNIASIHSLNAQRVA